MGESHTEELLKILKNTEKNFLSMCHKMMMADNGKLFLMDLYCAGIVQRSLDIISGFCKLVEDNNLLCASPLVRLHLDNILQIHAVFIVKDHNSFISKKMKGEQTNNLKDRNGKSMNDSYLSKKISEIEQFNWVGVLYQESSKYIHFTEKHIFSAFDNATDRGKFNMHIGSKKNVPSEFKKELLDAMIAISNGVLSYLQNWHDTKYQAANKNK